MIKQNTEDRTKTGYSYGSLMRLFGYIERRSTELQGKQQGIEHIQAVIAPVLESQVIYTLNEAATLIVARLMSVYEDLVATANKNEIMQEREDVLHIFLSCMIPVVPPIRLPQEIYSDICERLLQPTLYGAAYSSTLSHLARLLMDFQHPNLCQPGISLGLIRHYCLAGIDLAEVAMHLDKIQQADTISAYCWVLSRFHEVDLHAYSK